ncbi:MAG TPA: hypothetical protein VNN17_06630, partial [Terriglobia bacterium]|nr:hypothetical protein [Terriglobia bacterium]
SRQNHVASNDGLRQDAETTTRGEHISVNMASELHLATSDPKITSDLAAQPELAASDIDIRCDGAVEQCFPSGHAQVPIYNPIQDCLLGSHIQVRGNHFPGWKFDLLSGTDIHCLEQWRCEKAEKQRQHCTRPAGTQEEKRSSH